MDQGNQDNENIILILPVPAISQILSKIHIIIIHLITATVLCLGKAEG